MSWCCAELVRSEERTRSPRICATAVPLVEHLDLELKQKVQFWVLIPPKSTHFGNYNLTHHWDPRPAPRCKQF
jgi:hypothetical protein